MCDVKFTLQSMSDSTDGGGKNDKNHDKHEKHEKATTPNDPEANTEELRQNIRKAETDKMRIEAKIEALRLGGGM